MGGSDVCKVFSIVPCQVSTWQTVIVIVTIISIVLLVNFAFQKTEQFVVQIVLFLPA
jgi:hypothetical protein